MRPALLILDPDESRRRAVGEGLAAEGYESVPATSAAEGIRFLAALAGAVVVAHPRWVATHPELAQALARAASGNPPSTLVLLGELESDPQAELDEALVLDTEGLEDRELCRRLRLALVGREVGVEPDLELRSLVGELSLVPVLEVVRSLHRSHLTGRFELHRAGEIVFHEGEVIFAKAGSVVGAKALLRLGRLRDGPFHIHLEGAAVERNIEMSVDDLVLQAVEEAQQVFPDPRSRVRVTPAALDDAPPSELKLLEVVRGCSTLAEVLDALPATDGRVIQAVELLRRRGALVLEEPRVAVRVVTDSTSDLPPELVQSHDIVVVPLSIHFGDHAFRDGVEIQPRDFYHLLESSEEHPSTQPPSEAEFFEHYHDLVERQDVVSLHISEKLSQTVVHARGAVLRGSRTFGHLPPQRHNFAFEVIDTRNVSMGVGLLALFAARMARRGQKAFAIARRIESFIPRVEILFVVDTLDYLVRGGRIGRAQAWVGKLLGIKPILGVVDGEVSGVDRARGGRQAQERIVERLQERLEPGRPIIAVVAHARTPKWADRLRALIEGAFEVREMIATDIGPVVGTHAGPGCVGCVVFQPKDDEWPLVAPLED